MKKAKTISIFLALLLSSILAFAQHEDLMEQAHGISRDHMLGLFLAGNNIDENTPIEKLQEAVAYYYEHEAEMLYNYDVERHKVIVSGVSQARAARQSQWGQALTGMLSGVAQAVDISQQQAKAEREAKQSQAEMNRQQRIQERIAANQQAQDAARQSSQNAANSLNSTSSANYGSTGTKRDLYTSDPAWNKTVDIMVQTHGLEKTRQMVQQMRAQQAQESAQAYQQSHEWQQKSADSRSTQMQSVESSVKSAETANRYTSQESIITAITENRTQIYLKITQGIVTAYATQKDSYGRYNWSYGNHQISDIKYSPYYNQFKNEFSRTAIIGGIGHVFFN